MKTIKLRDFANLSEREMFSWHKDLIKVLVIDDEEKELITNTYDLILTWYGLEVHRMYPHYPYDIKEVISCKVYDDEALRRPLNFMLDQLMEVVIDPVEADLIKQVIYIWHFKINNTLSYLGSRGAVSATAEDVADVFYSEPIASIREALRNNEITYDEAESRYKQEILYNQSDEVINNSIFVMLARTGGVPVNMGFQLHISRGAGFDLNNTILPNPITESYAEGITNLADMLVENRAAGKALISNGKGLQDSEWFHRKLHIAASPVKTINHYVDCETTTGTVITLKDREMITAFIGKYLINDDGSTTLLTKARAKEVQPGTKVTFRSISWCRSHDGPCSKCYGQLRMSIPYNVMMRKSANPGMMSGTAIAEPIGQGMLSTKHFLRHVTAEAFRVMRGDAKYISTDGDSIFLTESILSKGCKILLPGQMLTELSDLRSMENLTDLQEDKLSTFEVITIKYEEEDPMLPGSKSESIVPVDVNVSSRQARMSKELIEYVNAKGWEKVDKYLEIDMSDFNPKYALLSLPYVYEDLNKYRLNIENFVSYTLKGNKHSRNKTWLETPITPESLGVVLTEFWGLINTKFKNINIVHLETLLHVTTGVSPKDGLYRLPVGDEIRHFVPFKKAIENRGMGSLMVFEAQINVFENPQTYFIKDREPTALEGFFTNAVK